MMHILPLIRLTSCTLSFAHSCTYTSTHSYPHTARHVHLLTDVAPATFLPTAISLHQLLTSSSHTIFLLHSSPIYSSKLIDVKTTLFLAVHLLLLLSLLHLVLSIQLDAGGCFTSLSLIISAAAVIHVLITCETYTAEAR